MRIAAAIVGLLLAAAPLVARAQGDMKTAPIPGDGSWTLTTVAAGGCFARLPGAQVDTMVLVNRDAKLVLSGGRPDWKFAEGDVAASLQVDGGAKHALTVSPVGNLFLVVIDDPTLAKAVEAAHRLTWTLPNGTFSAEVTGLGKAFDAATACGLAAARAG